MSLRVNQRHAKQILFCLNKRCLSTKSQSSKSVLDYCIELVRLNDYENYLCSLMIQNHARTAAFAIRAFNVEIAKVKESVNDKSIGTMRLQFWKDVILEIYNGKSRAQPVVLLLSEAVKKHNLSKNWFSRLITARESSLDDKPFMSIDDIESYGEKSVSPVLYLILESLGIKDVHADHAASHIGKAIGLTTVLRALPYNLQRRVVYLPIDLLIKHKISQEDMIRGRKREEAREIVFEIASQAHLHIEKAREMKSKIPSDAVRVCLPAVPCGLYLDKLQTVDFDVFHASLQQRNWKLPLHLFTKRFTGKY